MDRIAIAGPGLMGLGIAQVAALMGFEVMLLGRDAASASAGHARLGARLKHSVARGRMDEASAAACLARVMPARDDAALATCALAIEAVPEDRALKTATLHRLESLLPPGTLIATNTSGLPVSGLASALARPERFIGLHFFSPVERMKLVEVVRGDSTAQATLREALAFVGRLGQRPVVVRDGPGFFTSRVFAAYLDEAVAMVGEGVAPAAIEAAAQANGRARPPLALLDDISLTLNLQQARQAMSDGLPERFCRTLAAHVLARMVAAGRGGRQQGGGFYDHLAERVPWAGLSTLFPLAAVQPAPLRVQQRLRAVEVMEALRCLEEGVIASADDADAASTLGLGFPADQGGVLAWAERTGLPGFLSLCDELSQRHGERFAPSPWLRDLAAAGLGLSAWREPTWPSIERTSR